MSAPTTFSTEVDNPGRLSIGHLLTVVPTVLGPGGMLIILWLSLGALLWVVLRVLTLLSLGRRRQAAGF